MSVTISHMTARQNIDIAELGRRLAKRRADLDLDQDEVAERAGVSRAYVSRLERGIVPQPKVTDLSAVADALNLSLAELLAPAAKIIETRYSHELAEIQRQVAGLPPAQAERVLRGFRHSLEIAHGVSDLARRN